MAPSVSICMLFSVYDLDLASIQPSYFLWKWQDRLKRSKRYDAPEYYRPCIITCDNYAHSLRMGLMLGFCLEGLELWYAQDMAAGHDVPESSTRRDLTLPARQRNPGLVKEKRRAERKFVKQKFTSYERRLFREYSEAGAYVRKECALWQVSQPLALVVKIIDKVEGLATLHRCLTTYVKSENYQENDMPVDWVLLLGLKECRELYDRLEGQRYPTAPLCRELLAAVIDYVCGLWRNCPIDHVPDVISDFFSFRLPV